MKGSINFTMPVFNRLQCTQLSLLQLHKCDRDIPFTITVVDNGSEKAVTEKLLEFHQAGIIDHLFLLPRNMGIATACNVGWELVDADVYCKIDNDTMPLRKDWLTVLFRLWAHGKPFSNLGYASDEVFAQSPRLVETADGALGICESTLAGTGIFIPRNVHKVLGFWNEEYGLYGAEDGDYGVRMRYLEFGQYHYRARDFISYDLDDGLDEADYLRHGLDKQKERQSFTRDSNGYFGRFGINCFLYNFHIRSPRVCRRYKIVDIDKNHHVRLEETEEYREVEAALQECSRIICKTHVERGEKALEMGDLHERLKEIMRACGQDTEHFAESLEDLD